MPGDYNIPDIYVEEVPAGPRPIEAVGTRTAAFIGQAPKADAYRGQTRAVNNWTQFVNDFVGDSTASNLLANAVFGFFANSGSRCFIVNSAKRATDLAAALKALEAEDEVAILAAPGYSDTGSFEAVLTHCEKLQDRVAILDAPLEVKDLGQLTTVGTTGSDSKGLRPRKSAYGAFYFPGITVNDALSGQLVDVPPSGHIAGIWARSDATRGVHKAPANEVVRGALNVTYRLTREEQGALNPAGVNCIRYFPRQGILVWGARTLDEAASEWRYLNVRRLFNMIEESIAEATRWIVFEPNDRQLWKSIRRDIGAFLTRVWRDGALMGATAEQAFFVKCDEETNPPESIDAGMVVTIIGIAPVKPAEFVIFRISQHAGGAEIEAA